MLTYKGDYKGRIERAIALFHMNVLARFPAAKAVENRIVESYIDFLTTVREREWRERALPDFIIIGGMKCGSSSLYKYLRQHPHIFSSNYKEVRYFSQDELYSKGEKWYRTHFPKMKNLPHGSLVFEASPDYLFYPKVPVRIASLLPNVKLIALLRNPTERAISHYFHDIKMGRKKPEILDAMKFDDQFKQRGMYKEQIERYRCLFSPDNIMIISSEELFENPTGTLKDICLFLGVEPDVEISDLAPRQVGFNKEPVRADVYDYLNDYFRVPNQQLFEYIGKDFKW